jgi:hypothetical protein
MTTIDTSTWTEAQKADFAALEASIAEETGKTELAEAKREAERLSPVNVLAEKKAELAEKKKEAERAAKELVADEAFRKALIQYGGAKRVARVFCEEGSIILRPMTLVESDEFGARQEGLTDVREKMVAGRDSILETVIYPSKEEFLTWVEKWPRIDVFLYVARESLIAGIREDTAKKGCP